MSRTYTIRVMLIGLALACLAPVTIALIYSAMTDFSGDRARVKLFVHTLTRANAAKTSRILGEARDTLRTLAQRPSLAGLARSQCDPLLAEYIRLSRPYSGIMTIDPRGNIVCAAMRGDADAPVSAADTDWFQRVSKERTFTIGRHLQGSSGGHAVPVFAVPIWDEHAGVTGFVALSIGVDTFDSDIRASSLPEHSRYGIMRVDGAHIWSNVGPDTGAEPATVPPSGDRIDDVLRRLLQTRDGVVEGDYGDAVQRVYAIVPIAGTELYSYLGIPTQAAYGLDLQDSARVVAFGLANLIVAILAAIYLSRRIAGPVRALADSAESIQGGREDERATVSGTSETIRLGQAFNALVDNWQSVKRKLQQSVEEFEDLYQNAPCGYHSHDAKGHLLRINDTELAWLGYTRADIAHGIHMHDLLTEDGRRAFDQAMPAFLATGGVRGLELEYRRRDGTVLPGMVHASAVFNPDGRFIMSRSTLIDLTDRRAMEREVAARAQHAALLSRHLMNVEEQARRKLSAELHDRTSANVAALRTQLTVIRERLNLGEESDEAAMFDDCAAVLEDTNRSLREVCADLRPPLLDRAGLAKALESYVVQFARRTGIAVRFDATGLVRHLPPEVESNLFRVAQEALTNAAKHSQARRIDVGLSEAGDNLVLTVRDDGKGFDPEALTSDTRAGLGLMTMRDRSEFIAGRFAVESAPGRGTVVTVEIQF